MNEEKITVDLAGLRWRSSFSQQIGGGLFDESGGDSFSAGLAEERKLEKANIPDRPDTALLKFSAADPTWKMPARAMTAAIDYFEMARDATRRKDVAGVRWTRDTIMTGDTNEMLAEAIQYRHSVVTENDQVLTADWVQYSPGAIKRALAEYIPTLLFGKGTTLLFPTPSCNVMASPMNLRGADLVDAPLNYAGGGKWLLPMNWLTDIAAEHTRVKRGPLAMYVNIPHNPTGMAYTQADWQELIAWAIECNVTLVVDEAYIDLRYRDSIISVLQVPGWEKCCIVLQSVSKGWSAAGLRFGWIVAHPTVIKALRKIMDAKDSGMFGPSIVAGIWCLLNPEMAEKTKERYRRLHCLLAGELNRVGFSAMVPDAGLYQFTPAPKAASGNAFALSFKDAAEVARWFRSVLRISVMPAEAAGGQWLEWAVTLQPVPECGLPTEESIIGEAARRLQNAKFTF